MDIFSTLAVKIIKSQEQIIGPLAIQQAQGISGLEVNWPKQEVQVNGNKTQVVDKLIEKYRSFFGPVAVEVSKSAVSELLGQLSDDQIPESLK